MAENRNHVGTTIEGKNYTADKDGFFNMPERHAKMHAQVAGLSMPGIIGALPASVGYRCTCGHGSFFVTCGKCGGTCTREGAA
jgi:hypothetical protein